MSRLPEFCGHTDDHAEHEWTDRRERDFECPGWRDGEVMWGPAPMADSDISAEAVEAGKHAWRANPYATDTEVVRDILAAALPHIRARVLAEVDAALRDAERWWAWYLNQSRKSGGTWADIAADYLRDVFGGDSGEVG
jgi:hypothetical protein